MPPHPRPGAGRGPGAPPVLAERRQLTVMFADLVGSTELSRRLDPEEMDELLRAYQNAVAGEVARFEGHVAKFMGDGVLAYFGWPSAHEDEAERAVRAGLAAVEAVGRLATPTGEPLAARVGIATGLVVVGGLVGEGAAQEQAIAGETPNLAARLQALAEPGTVLVADVDAAPDRRRRSRSRTSGRRRSRASPSRCGRGACSASARSAAASRRARPAWRRWSGASRRSRSCSTVGSRPATATGRWCCSRGEPGIGKSRIARALCERLEGEPHVQLHHQCSPYYVDTALHPAIEHLERAAGFAAGRHAGGQAGQARGPAGARPTDRSGEAAPLIAALLSVPPEGRYPPLTAAPQRQREATIDALVERVDRPRPRAAGAERLRGPALGRPDHAGAARPADRADRGRCGCCCC